MTILCKTFDANIISATAFSESAAVSLRQPAPQCARDDHTAALSIHKHLVKAILEHRHDHRCTKDPMHNNLISVHGNPYSNEAIDTIQWLMIEPTLLKKVHSLYKSVQFHSRELYYILFKMDSNLHV